MASAGCQRKSVEEWMNTHVRRLFKLLEFQFEEGMRLDTYVLATFQYEAYPILSSDHLNTCNFSTSIPVPVTIGQALLRAVLLVSNTV